MENGKKIFFLKQDIHRLEEPEYFILVYWFFFITGMNSLTYSIILFSCVLNLPVLILGFLSCLTFSIN